MADPIRVNNNELIINESHTNKFIFFLHTIPTSYLFSKFFEGCVREDCKPRGYYEEIFKEQNNDVRNFTLFLQSFDLPSLDLDTENIGTKFIDIPILGKLRISNLTTNIINDENWFIYRMLLYWMYAAHNPEEHNKWNEYEYYTNFFTRGTLIIIDNHLEKVAEFEFTDLHPSSIGQVSLKHSGAEKIILPITWVHTGFVPSDRIIIKRV
jgi:hypothetical protein